MRHHILLLIQREGPEGLDRKNFRNETQCSERAGPRIQVLLEALNEGFNLEINEDS
jgi:hypothetical protein